MQGDGNLVVYDAFGSPQWSSITNGHDGAYLTVQDENVVVRSPSGASKLWWGGLTPRWVPASAIPYYEAGYDYYNQGRIDLLAWEWHYYYFTPGSECHWAFPGVASIMRTIAGQGPNPSGVTYSTRGCSQLQ